MFSFFLKIKLISVLFCGFWTLGAFGQDADPKSFNSDIYFQLPINLKSDRIILQTKRSGVKSELELEVGAMEKIVAPAEGLLIYAGWLSSSSNGFIIKHNNKFISIISSPLSFEKIEDFIFGEKLSKGQLIATMRGGNSDAERSLKWSLHSIDDDNLLIEIQNFISNQKPSDYSIIPDFVTKISDKNKINIKNILEMGTLQFNFSAADKLDYCEVILSGLTIPCQKADNFDHLLPKGMYKIDIVSGRFFKTTKTSINLVSKSDTVIQDVGKDDSGNFYAGSYGVERSDEHWESKNLINNFYVADKKLNAISRSDYSSNLNEQDVKALTELQQSLKDPKIFNEAEERQRIAAEAAKAALLQAQRQEELQKAQAAEKERQQTLAVAESNRKREAEERQRIAAEAVQAALLQAQRLALLEREKLQKIAALDFERKRNQIINTNRKALIMGNDGYKDVPTLMNARSDARSMSATLNKLGFDVSTHFDLSERGMKDAIRNFKSKVNGGDEVVVYFAGHGVQLGATNYLLPVDIRGQSEDQVKDEAIPLQRLLDDLQDTKARFALSIIDACRDNPFKNTGRSIGGRGLTSTSAVTGQMVMFSAGTGQQALDRLGPDDKEPNGLFTRILLQEIQKPGVPIERIVRNVRNEVAKLSRSVGHEQVPAVYDQTLGDFFFSPAKD